MAGDVISASLCKSNLQRSQVPLPTPPRRVTPVSCSPSALLVTERGRLPGEAGRPHTMRHINHYHYHYSSSCP
jgi:hypothetical protein